MTRLNFIRKQFNMLRANITEINEAETKIILDYNYGEFMGMYYMLEQLLNDNDGTSLYEQMKVRRELDSIYNDAINVYTYQLKRLTGNLN